MIWQAIEKKLITYSYDEVEMTSYENVCYTRIFFLKEKIGINEEKLGKAIASYVVALDKAISIFMDNMEDTDYAVSRIYSIYREYYEDAKLII